VNFAEQPPSTEWAALKYRGEELAEVWLKPEGEPFGLTFRIPQKTFQLPGVGRRLTTESLLKAVGIAAEDVASWRHGDVSHAATDGPDRELRQPLPPPPPDASHLSIHVSLKPPPPAVAGDEGVEAEAVTAKWQDLEARWNVILGVEATMEGLRLRMDTLRAEMEAASRHSLRTEEKLHASNADVVQWNRAKNRMHYSLPKAKEYIHRVTWLMVTPERKELEEFIKNPDRAQVPLAQLDKVGEQLESLRKDRQILHAQGVTVYQECSGVLGEVQGALRMLQRNAAANEREKMRATRAKGKFF
jgi:hypothetical protein